MCEKLNFRAFLRQLGSYPEVANAIAEAAASMEEINVDARTDENGVVQPKLHGIVDNLNDIRKHTKKLLQLLNLEHHWELEDGVGVEGEWGLSQAVFDYLESTPKGE